MKWRRNIPTCITLGILLLGFHSILKSIAGEFVPAAQFIVLAAILDGLDGEVARLFRGITNFGARLDTYVDTISFGAAPAVLVYQAMWQDYGMWGTVVVSFIVIAAVIRFARYDYKQSRVGHHTFRGLPIPVSGVWMAMYVILTESNTLAEGKFFLDHGPLALVMWACTFAFLILQVSRVRYAKPTKEVIGFGLLATVVLMAVMGRPVLAFCIGTCVGLCFFAFAVPFYVHGNFPEEEEDSEEQPVEVRR